MFSTLSLTYLPTMNCLVLHPRNISTSSPLTTSLTSSPFPSVTKSTYCKVFLAQSVTLPLLQQKMSDPLFSNISSMSNLPHSWHNPLTSSRLSPSFSKLEIDPSRWNLPGLVEET